jgi:hypothetical protein
MGMLSVNNNDVQMITIEALNLIPGDSNHSVSLILLIKKKQVLIQLNS